jgi:hypothetical protein
MRRRPSLFVIGGIVGLEAEASRAWRPLRRATAAASAGRLRGAVALAPVDPALRTAAVVYASMPMLSIYPILAQKYRGRVLRNRAARATLLSFVTVSAILVVSAPRRTPVTRGRREAADSALDPRAPCYSLERTFYGRSSPHTCRRTRSSTRRVVP